MRTIPTYSFLGYDAASLILNPGTIKLIVFSSLRGVLNRFPPTPFVTLPLPLFCAVRLHVRDWGIA